jgi:hypothetical protein
MTRGEWEAREAVNRTVYDAAVASHQQTGAWPFAMLLSGDVMERSGWGDPASPGARPGVRPEIVDGVLVSGKWQGAFDRSIVSGETFATRETPRRLIFIGRDDRLPPGSMVPVQEPVRAPVTRSQAA